MVNHWKKRRALAALAGIYREQEENALALKTYQKALELYRKVDDPLGEGPALANIGHLYLLRQQFEDARMVFQRAIGLATQVQDEDTLWHAHWGLGRCLHIAGELEKAVEAFQNCLDKIKQRHRELRTDEGKVTFLESVQDIFNHLIAVHLDLAQSDPNAYRDVLKVAEEARGQALYDLMGSRRRQFWSRQTDVRRTRLLPFSQRARNITSDSFNPAVQMAPGVSSASGSLGLGRG